MLLVIDCGNTNIVFAVYDGEANRGTWRIATETSRTADEYAVWLTQLMTLDGLDRNAIEGVAIASVVPDALFNLKVLARRYFHAEPLVVGEPGTKLGIEVKIDRPEEAGADRLVNALAAHRRHGGPLIVVDIGTATTFDVVDADGNYCGGVIAPGPNLSVRALTMAAAKLPAVAIRRPPSVIGKSTVPAIQSGVYWGYVGMIEGLVERIRNEFGAPMKVIGTGGLAPLFSDATPAIEIVDEDITLIGLVLIWRLNRP